MSSSLRKKVILHLIPDEKVTLDIIDNFDKAYSSNLFIVYSSQGFFQHVKIEKKNIFKVKEVNLTFLISQYHIDGIIIHGLNSAFAEALQKTPDLPKLAWVEWGFDIYNIPKSRPLLYGKRTKSFLSRQEFGYSLKLYIKRQRSFRRFYYKYVIRKKDLYNLVEELYPQFNFFCTYIKEDYEYFSIMYPNNMEFVHLAFSNINQYLSGNENLRISKGASSILLGNSNSPENNHLDALEKLSNYKSINFEKIIVPLSYGENASYRSYVIGEGKKLFCDKFQPLTNFLDREQYVSLLQTCSTGIFYHFRQQAMGNIIALLYMGCRVYLSKKNPAFHFFKRIGIVVFDFDEEFSIYTNTILPDYEAETNRKLLYSIFSEEKVEQDINNLINKLLNVN